MTKSGYQFIRFYFGILNTIFLISGFCLIGLGLFNQIYYDEYTTLLPHYPYLSTNYFAFLTGSLIILLSTLASCGSWMRNKYLLIAYFLLLLCLIIFEFSIGCMMLLYQKNVHHFLRKELVYGISNYYNVSSDSYNLVDIWDQFHAKFNCCGVNNYEDFYMIDAWPSKKWVPDSCCATEENCGQKGNPALFNEKGCYKASYTWFIENLRDRMLIVEGIGISIGFLQLSGLIISMILFCAARHKTTSSRSYHSYS